MVRITVVLMLAAHIAAAQHANQVHSPMKKRAPAIIALPAPPVVYTVVEERAEFRSGQDGLDAYLSNHLRYPEEAAEAGIQGRVFVQFVIDEQGRVGSARVVRGLYKGCDTEALRVVRAMPAWRPAKFNGEARSSVFLLPILFQKK